MTSDSQFIEIYQEATPNPEALKFVTSKMILPRLSADFPTVEKAAGSPIASALFSLPMVTGVFIAQNFITINKRKEDDWFEISPIIKEKIKSLLVEGIPAVTEEYVKMRQEESRFSGLGSGEEQIMELLDKYVKPAVEMDGGHISLESFEDGIVRLRLQGSCSGCPSSSITLKNGIEGLLKRMVPEVKEVVAVES